MTQQSDDQGKNVTPSSRPMSEQDQGMVDQGMFGQGPQPSGQRTTGRQTGGSEQSGASGQGLSDQLQGAVGQVQDTIQNIAQGNFSQVQDKLQNITQGDFSLQNLVSERPWMAIGAAVAAGYVLGSMGGGDDTDAAHSTLSTRGYPSINYSNPVPPMYPGSASASSMPSSYSSPAYTASTPSSYSSPTYASNAPSSYSSPAYTASMPSSYPSSTQATSKPSSYPGSSSSWSSSRSQGPSFFDQLDEEIDMLKTAAISTIRSLLRENLGEYMGKLNVQHQRASAGRPANMPSAEEYPQERSVGQGPGRSI